MKYNDDDVIRRTKLTEKGRRDQKFRNFVKQIDPHNIEELDEEEDFHLEYKQKVNNGRRI
jgi:hypothetical protein